jgi:hypothetical protein
VDKFIGDLEDADAAAEGGGGDEAGIFGEPEEAAWGEIAEEAFNFKVQNRAFEFFNNYVHPAVILALDAHGGRDDAEELAEHGGPVRREYAIGNKLVAKIPLFLIVSFCGVNTEWPAREPRRHGPASCLDFFQTQSNTTRPGLP